MLKGELFNQNMVRALLEGRKLHTARPINFEFLPGFNPDWFGYSPVFEYGNFFLEGSNHRDATKRVKPKYQIGDYMYVRETWTYLGTDEENNPCFAYKVGSPHLQNNMYVKWRPSIHMPREAARLFFRVAKVSIMRLEDVDERFAAEDGFQSEYHGWAPSFNDPDSGGYGNEEVIMALDTFRSFWLSQYGPDARWMWVYWMEPVTREEALSDGKPDLRRTC